MIALVLILIGVSSLLANVIISQDIFNYDLACMESNVKTRSQPSNAIIVKNYSKMVLGKVFFAIKRKV